MVQQGVPLHQKDIQQVLDICLRNEQLEELEKFLKQLEASQIQISEHLLAPILIFAGRRANPEFTLKVRTARPQAPVPRITACVFSPHQGAPPDQGDVQGSIEECSARRLRIPDPLLRQRHPVS
jgi:hypothetical protein